MNVEKPPLVMKEKAMVPGAHGCVQAGMIPDHPASAAFESAHGRRFRR